MIFWRSLILVFPLLFAAGCPRSSMGHSPYVHLYYNDPSSGPFGTDALIHSWI